MSPPSCNSRLMLKDLPALPRQPIWRAGRPYQQIRKFILVEQEKTRIDIAMRDKLP